MTENATPSQQEINIGQLSLEQLDGLKNQLEQELRQFTSSFGGLKEAQARFHDSHASLEAISPENEGKNIMVPLTSSMYIPGKLSNVSEVLVDIGTGYYVEKSVPDAKKIMERKIQFLQKNTDMLQQVIENKRTNLEAVIGVMQQKISAYEQSEAASRK